MVLERKTQSHRYWAETFKVNQDDIDVLYNVLLEREIPLSTDEIALVLVRLRVKQETETLEEQLADMPLYRPDGTYKKGDEIAFPTLRFATGKVVKTRKGHNPEYGDFRVITVDFGDDEEPVEFASQLEGEHALTRQAEDAESGDEEILSAEDLFIEYGDEVADEIERALANHEDIVRISGNWFPRSLVADVNIGHLNLAEAVLDIAGGGPLDTLSILEQVDLPASVNPRLQEFSMDFALQEDERFDEVGPAGQVLWYLRRMEPPEVQFTPPRLVYEPVEFDPESIPAELQQLEAEIHDEYSPLRVKRTRAQSITVTLTFPHWRVGSLPLAAKLRSFFPTAYEAPVIRFVLVDGQSGDEMPGWVVRKERYVFGLDEWYRRYDLQVGSYIHISHTDDPGKVQVDFGDRPRPRKEWIRIASVANHQLAFESEMVPIGADYDELMALGVEDLQALDSLWLQFAERQRDLTDIILIVFKELARLTPQGNVHARTLYSAVNVLRRCPPGPIFARLVNLPELEHVGGVYWKLARQEDTAES